MSFGRFDDERRTSAGCFSACATMTPAAVGRRSAVRRAEGAEPTLIRASALMTMAVPVGVFLLAQRAFMRGVVVTGVEK